MQKKTAQNEIFSKEELFEIQQLIVDLRKIRKVDKKAENLKEQIEKATDQQYFYVGDFIMNKGYHKNREKVDALWQLMRKEFGGK
jgi:hypothetical protein